MQPETLKLADLKPDARNANKGTARGRKAVADSLQSYGTGRSILIDRDNRIIAGNKTTEGASVLPSDDVLVIDSDGSKLIAIRRTDLSLETDAAAKALAIADNRTSELGLEWDVANLRELVIETNVDSFFTAGELEKILGPAEAANELADARIDQSEELRAKWKTERGQLWRIPSKNCAGFSHQILCGDSTSKADVRRLFGQRVAAMVNTDPPYGVNYTSNATGAIANDAKGGNALAALLIDSLGLAVKHTTATAAFYVWHASSTRRDFEHALDELGLEEKQYIVWAKDSFVLGHADYHWQTEPCLLCAEGRIDRRLFRTARPVDRLETDACGLGSVRIRAALRDRQRRPHPQRPRRRALRHRPHPEKQEAATGPRPRELECCAVAGRRRDRLLERRPREAGNPAPQPEAHRAGGARDPQLEPARRLRL